MMETMNRVNIAVQPRPYQAIIENGLLERAGSCLHDLLGANRKVFVVTVPPVRRRWGKRLVDSLARTGFAAKLITMPDGERYKKMATVEALAEKLVALGAERNALLVALGGGVVGDVTGFLAAIYLRGVEVVQIPTTVLAQVDASIGGKTGVNLKAGKNLVGSFHHPRAVLIDPEVLSTLPEREFRAGIYESLKCGVIGHPELFRRLEKLDIKTLRSDTVALEWVIAQSVHLKAEVVAADERENGLRRILNFGHTIGHALEADTEYRHFLHGEAVAWGMVAAAHVAVATGHLHVEDGKRITQAVLARGKLPKVQSRSRGILRRLQSDKKTRDGVVHFVLPTEIGKVQVVNDVPERVVTEAVDELRRLSH
jgi:3-dehydroquinate synthase